MAAVTPKASVVVCSIDAAKFARVRANYTRLFGAVPFEMVGIHDARSLAEGYARGIAASRGEWLILSHDDIEILNADAIARLTAHLTAFDLVGIAGTTRVVGPRWAAAGDPYVFGLWTQPLDGQWGTMLRGGGELVVPGIEALDGVFMAMRREVAQRVPFDAATFDGFHLYDIDFSFRASLAGFRLAVCRDVLLIHESEGRYDARWAEYANRFRAKFADRLPARWQPVEGAQGNLLVKSREEILARCAPERLAPILRQIEAANGRPA